MVADPLFRMRSRRPAALRVIQRTSGAAAMVASAAARQCFSSAGHAGAKLDSSGMSGCWR